MKLNLLLLITMPFAAYAQDSVAISQSQYPNTFSSGSAYVSKFDNKARKFKDWSVSVGGGAAFMTSADLTSFYGGKPNWGWNVYASLDKQISHTVGLALQYQTGKTNQQGRLPEPYGSLAGVANAWTKYYQVSVIGDVNFSNLMRRVDNNSPYRWALHGYAGVGLEGYNTELIDAYASRWSTTPRRVPIIVEQPLNIASFFFQAGVGLSYKISRSLDIDTRLMYIVSGDEELDGGGWTRTTVGSVNYNEIATQYSDNILTANLGLRYHFGKHISHLTWHDPLQDVYGRIHALDAKNVDLVVCEKGDNDNDGVCDDWDRQLDTPAGARVDGAGVALDVDLDGVIDLNDQCVTVPGLVENIGCPLTDNKNTGSVVEVDRNFEGIEFALDKDIIRPQSFDKLNHAAEVIKTLSPDDKLLVIGCTDTRATDAYNLRLSQRRANAVVKYLVGKGVSKNMLTPEGRGAKDLKYPECNPASKCEEWKNEANRRVYFQAK